MVYIWQLYVNIGLRMVVNVLIEAARVYPPPHFSAHPGMLPSMLVTMMSMGHCRPRDPQGRCPFSMPFPRYPSVFSFLFFSNTLSNSGLHSTLYAADFSIELYSNGVSAGKSSKRVYVYVCCRRVPN
jgi:hypothetical protein